MRVHPQPKTHIINKGGIASSKEPVRHPLPARVPVGVGGLVCYALPSSCCRTHVACPDATLQ